jgi:hypothetical protein
VVCGEVARAEVRGESAPAAEACPFGIMIEHRAGYVRLLQVGGIPVFVHWSLLILGLLTIVFVSLNVRAAAYVCVGYALVIAVHEAGHVIAARHLRLKVHAIYFSGLSGECRLELPRSPKEAFFAWSGGPLAQVVLLLCSFLYVQGAGAPTTG